MPRVNPAAACVIAECPKPQHGRGWCGTHYYRWLSNGDPVKKQDRTGAASSRWQGHEIGYNAAHIRVRKVRGAASAHLCGCGRQAAHWAYSHADPAERHDDRGRAYSTNPDHYSPMCVSCHKKADLWRKAMAS